MTGNTMPPMELPETAIPTEKIDEEISIPQLATDQKD
jgi:hypothetical protein